MRHTTGTLLMQRLGMDASDLTQLYGVSESTAVDISNAVQQMPMRLESRVYETIADWGDLKKNVARWYVETFEKDPMIVIGLPCEKFASRHGISEKLLSSALASIVEEIGPDFMVDVADLATDPPLGEELDRRAEYWLGIFVDFVGARPNQTMAMRVANAGVPAPEFGLRTVGSG